MFEDCGWMLIVRARDERTQAWLRFARALQGCE